MGAADFWVRLVGPDGAKREGPLSVMWPVRFEAGHPSRSFPSYRGQQNFTGWYWSATGHGHVPYESWPERDHLMRLDFDSAVVGMAARPFALSWRDDELGPLTHAPDFFAQRADGTPLVVDVRPDERISERDAAKFAGTRTACGLVGWGYELGMLDPVFAANLRWWVCGQLLAPQQAIEHRKHPDRIPASPSPGQQTGSAREHLPQSVPGVLTHHPPMPEPRPRGRGW
ncbi:TnsA-like heteromeric transposase endonuclease subunit [Streptomyces sp. NPDC058307]|uniref:TnsA-like heteromeric transposase endonuclease subunit n=1 Tax=Streptomyces sp. NPDC058307 TaxID=3346439 RepID=UPI0036E4FD25